MKRLKKVLLYSLLVVAASCIHPAAQAQAPGFYDDTEDTLTIPLDGGMTLLVAGGLLLAVWRLQKRRGIMQKTAAEVQMK